MQLSGIALLKSLRARYLIAAVVLALAILTSAWIAQTHVADASRVSATNLRQRSEVHAITREIRYALWDAQNALQAYVLSPSPQQRSTFSENMRKAIDGSEKLVDMPWIASVDAGPDVAALRDRLREVEQRADELMRLRTDVEGLFPAMTTMRDVMTPNNRGFYTAATLALQEIHEESDRIKGNTLYRKFFEIRKYWTQMITVFRGYVALLTGTFGEDNPDIRQQEANVEVLYGHITTLLAQLEEAGHRGELGLQGSASVQEMRQNATAWHHAYLGVKRIYASENWRADVTLVENKLRPAFQQLRSTLTRLDRDLERAALEDMGALTGVSNTIIQTYWVLSAMALLFVIAGYVVLSRTVLTPVAQIAHALKQEAFGAKRVALPRVDSEETQQLVDAFAEMRDQVHYRQMALEYQALHDTLTGLPNRTLLQSRLQQTIDTARRDRDQVALLIMDLDRFKEINDTLGHQIGDKVLQQVAARLIHVLRDYDTVSRLGGDEFAVLLPSADQSLAAQMADRLLNALERIFKIEEHNLYVGGSIGIARYPEHGDDAQTLIQRADVAMYVAKRANCGYSIYNTAQDPHSVGRLALVNELRHAIVENGLELEYHPKVDLQSGAVVGVEALLRWHHAELGYISPSENIPIAEQTGLIKPLTLWVLNTALNRCAQLRRRGVNIIMGINLSVWNLQDPDLYDLVREQLLNWNVPPGSLELEITEGAMMADPDRAKDILTRLDSLGVRLAVDDFGTGFSSLGYLKRLPVDELKIDKSFVMDMPTDDNDAVIVRSTIDLAHNLGLKVVAEGVENREVWDLLCILGCDTAQGNFISKPLPSGKLDAWINEYARARRPGPAPAQSG